MEKETRGVGIWCQFSQKPSSVSTDLWGMLSKQPHLGPQSPGQPAWVSTDLSRDVGRPRLWGYAGKGHPALQSAHVWDTGLGAASLNLSCPQSRPGDPREQAH